MTVYVVYHGLVKFLNFLQFLWEIIASVFQDCVVSLSTATFSFVVVSCSCVYCQSMKFTCLFIIKVCQVHIFVYFQGVSSLYICLLSGYIKSICLFIIKVCQVHMFFIIKVYQVHMFVYYQDVSGSYVCLLSRCVGFICLFIVSLNAFISHRQVCGSGVTGSAMVTWL